MFTILSHAGHSHDAGDSMSFTNAIDHCMPILIGAAIIVAILLAVIVYFLVKWQPKSKTNPVSKDKDESQ